MHKEVGEFLARVRALAPKAFEARKVFEAGSFDVNGTPRPLFQPGTEYVGVDWRPGPGVDKVSLIHEYSGHPSGHFDVAISTETFEHDPHWAHSLTRMIDLVRRGGHLIVTAAGPGRDPHCVETAPKKGYYAGIALEQLLRVVTGKTRWSVIYAEDDPVAQDVRVAAFEKL
jgi:hypothetical protein